MDVNMRQIGVCLTALAMFATDWGRAAEQPDPRPNIILLVADDLAYGALGYNGNADVKTPHIDRLADDGLAFDYFYVTTSAGMASRASIMTGMYEYKTGCNFQHGPLPPILFQQSYPVLLRKHGYFTGFAGKFGFAVREPETGAGYHSYDDMPIDQFDWWRGWTGEGSYRTAWNKYVSYLAERHPHVTGALGAASVEFIRRGVDSGKPFCLSVSFKAPHNPQQPDRAYHELYPSGMEFDKPPNYGPECGLHLAPQARSGPQVARFKTYGWSPDSFDTTISKYYQLIHGVDVAVGTIRAELAAQGIAENTVIVFTSDNGYFLGSHGFGGKTLPYQESARVPLIIFDPRAPSAARGRRCDSLCANIDLAPTLLDLAGVPAPENVDGISLVPALSDPIATVHESLLFMQTLHSMSSRSLTVYRLPWKYTWWYYAGGEMKPTEELFNLEKDPLEMRNRASDAELSETLREMRQLYDRHLTVFRREGVNVNDYARHKLLFDRHEPWKDKAPLAQR